jgi:hypothetical protein
MLTNEINGIKVNKSDHRRTLLPLLNNRSESAIEFKHQNISAALIEMGLPFIKGYLPLYHFQGSKLTDKISEYIQPKPSLESLFIDFVNNAPTEINSIEFNSLIVPAPEKKKKPEEKIIVRKPLSINYLEREQNNRSLGLKGEELAIQYERFLLRQAGKESLADKIEWVSKDVGDGLGFDILSKNLNGSDKYVEVKTTKLGKEAPFFFSANEYNFSKENRSNYHLYRLFNFNEAPKMFTLMGSFDSFCNVEPVQFRGKF